MFYFKSITVSRNFMRLTSSHYLTFAAKLFFSVWKNTSFSWQKNKKYSGMWKCHGFIPRRWNRMQKYSPGGLSDSLCSSGLFLRMVLWTHIQDKEYWQHNGSKRTYTSRMYPILQELFFFTNKSSGCACLHSVSVPESKSEQMDSFSHCQWYGVY